MRFPEILQTGDPRLHQPAQPIADPLTESIQQLIDTLIAITIAKNGVGIAAPQIGIGLQLIIVASRPNPRYPHAPLMEPTAMINPQILARAPDLTVGWEGCLSVVGQRGQVPRHDWVEVAYVDRQGHPQRATFQGFIARIIQHEVDHLAGKVFLERLTSPEDVVDEDTFQRLFAHPV